MTGEREKKRVQKGAARKRSAMGRAPGIAALENSGGRNDRLQRTVMVDEVGMLVVKEGLQESKT